MMWTVGYLNMHRGKASNLKQMLTRADPVHIQLSFANRTAENLGQPWPN